MADRFFPNIMPDFVAEKEEEESRIEEEKEIAMASTSDPLLKLLSMPYSKLSERFKRAALDLKETIVMETWGLTGQHVADYTLYSGFLGTAYLVLKAYRVTNNKNDLNLCLEIVKACDSASLHSEYSLHLSNFVHVCKDCLSSALIPYRILLNSWSCIKNIAREFSLVVCLINMVRDVTFICGRAGVCAVGAVAAKYAGDEQLLRCYLTQFHEIKLPRNIPNELLYGRAGFLWACLFLNIHIGEGAVPTSYSTDVVNEIIKNGRKLGDKLQCPLMFEWYGEKYWGAAHGLAGIMHVLMYMDLKPDELEDVQNTLEYMIKNRFPSGNYAASKEDRKRDVLVHWCHGAPGVALTLIRAAEVFGDEFLEAAMQAAQVVWNLWAAEASWNLPWNKAHKLTSQGEIFGGDNTHSMFEGIGGMAYLFLDMIEPNKSSFPAYEL